MAKTEPEGSRAQRAPHPAGPNGGTRRLLRSSHIFASAVQEILERDLLRDVSSDSLTISQFHLLKLICASGRHQVGEAADFLGVSPPAASKNIDKLERMGLVSRHHSTGDRRAILLEARREGRDLVARYEDLKSRTLEPVFEAFSGDELEQLSHLLERFSVALIEAKEAADEICLRCSAYYDENCPVRRIRNGCPYHRVRETRMQPAAAGTT